MKNLKNLGRNLSKVEQKTISGGKRQANPPSEPVACYTVNYGCTKGGFHYCSASDEGAFPISFSAIYPAPIGC